MPSRTLVTAALPYANGSLHLGHLVEYCQVDMYVRALKRLGRDAIFMCADDTHGTPIELNAQRQGIPPEELVHRYHVEHKRDFARFDVAFDNFGLTHSETNRGIVEDIYKTLRDRGYLEDREMDGIWCNVDKRFLPDRFIRGTCPVCSSADQYGDVCEVCGSTYSPQELKSPRCAICATPPVVRKTTHVFFKISKDDLVEFLREWIDAGALQSDVANYVRNWIEGGLKDWCITRDGPYFGFSVPDREGKYFYVWLDAPIGYMASSAEWGARNDVSFDALWRSPETRIEHVIGKDIVYFHTLFWPAVLKAAGYTLPSKVHVHGMLTIDGEKMSKSRGTFINAAVFAEHIEPQALRYYYACKYSSVSDDLDLSFDDFVLRVNGELVNKHANLFSRAAQFLHQKLDGRIGDMPFAAADTQAAPNGDGSILDLARQVVAASRRAEKFFENRELGQAMREISAIADIGNEFMQSSKPWDQLKTDPEAARLTCTFAMNVCYALAMYLWPVVPRFAEAASRQLEVSIDRMSSELLFAQRNRKIGPLERLFERIDKKQVDAVVEASKQTLSKTPESPVQHTQAVAAGLEPVTVLEKFEPLKPTIAYGDFEKLDLRMGLVKAAERVPKSKKLLKLSVDIGEPEPRQIVAGLGAVYAPETLLNTRVIVVANLAPAKLMGIESQGMVLAAGENMDLAVLRADRELPPGSIIR
ncbi:MAG: methionine--tRNA ligase [Clostridia bacterium]|nr:methionine--tRNA ligase [Deltaproteobacteria bacterium]